MKKTNLRAKSVRVKLPVERVLAVNAILPLTGTDWMPRLLEAIPEGIFLVDAYGLIRFANRRGMDLFGCEQKEIIGLPIDLLLPQNFRQPHKKHREKYMAQPLLKPMGIGRELFGRRLDGSEFPVEVIISPFDTDDGVQVVCQVTDISGRLATESGLRMMRNRFESLFNAFPLPVFVWQRKEDDFYLVDYNESNQNSAIQVVQSFVGRSLSTMYPVGGGEVEAIQRCYREKVSFKNEYHDHYVRSTDNLIDNNQVITCVFGEPDLVMVIIENDTEKRASLNELKKLSSVVEQTADAVFIADRNGFIEYVNPGFEAITGYTRAEALGKTPRILKSGQMPVAYYQKLWKTVLGGDVFHAQTMNRKRDGSLFVAEQTITPIKDQEGQITHLVSVLKDMTERILLQEQQTEHRLAGIVQNRLFPARPPQIAGYDIAGAIFPAEATSGDYFDYIAMPDNAIGLVVADVSGHGMSSALLMAESRAYLRSIIKYESDPQTVLEKLNIQLLPDLIEDSNFITAFFARLDPDRHILEYANAGNWPTYIFNRQGKVTHELRTNGTPLGTLTDLALRRTEPISLAPGSLAVFLTDGIPEAHNAVFRDFGAQRLLSVIRRHRLAPAHEIIDQVREAVLGFMMSTQQADDQTIIICKRVN